MDAKQWNSVHGLSVVSVEPMDVNKSKKDLPEVNHPVDIPEQGTDGLCTKHLNTFVASLSAALASIGLGTVVSYSSPALPDLNEHRNVFHLSPNGITWVASVIYMTGLCGGAVGGILLDRYGRKSVLALTSLSLTFGWLVIAASPDASWMLVGRLVTGLAIAFADVAVPTYIAEIADPSVRGFLGSWHELGANIGFLFVFAMGCFLHWNWIAVASMAFPVLLMVCLLFIPESPRWLLSQGRKLECADVLKHLRKQEDITEEMAAIEEVIKQESGAVQWKEFGQPSLYKPLIVVVGLMFFQQMSGYCPLLGYSVDILDSTGTSWNSFWISAGIGLVGTVSNLISAVVVDRAGRRVMLMISSGIMIISMAGLSSFFTVKHFCTQFDIAILSWLPMVAMMAFNFGMAIGYGPIPYYLASELFPLKARGLAGGIGTCCVHTFAFTSIFIFPYLRECLENYMLYWILTCVAVCGMAFAYVLVPETKGKTLEEIEMEFKQ